jgi:hypothetical protein
MTVEDIVKWLLGIFATFVVGGFWMLVGSVRELRKANSVNTEKLHRKIDDNAKEFRDGYVRSGELAEVKMMLRSMNDKFDTLTRELIKHRRLDERME